MNILSVYSLDNFFQFVNNFSVLLLLYKINVINILHMVYFLMIFIPLENIPDSHRISLLDGNEIF